MWRRLLFFIIAVVVVALDQITKLWVVNVSKEGETFAQFSNLYFTHIQNTGAAFGMFQNQTIFLAIIASIGLIIIILFYRYIAQSSIIGVISLGLVFGGAIGNLTDRIRIGYVTDFIYVRLWDNVFWPAFNIADSSISIGICLLVWFILISFKKETKDNVTASIK
jgi:signal peptidase II